MKKIYIIVFLTVAIASVIIGSCSRNEVRIESEKLAEIEQAGVIHNEALNSVLNDLWLKREQMFLKEGKAQIVATRGSADFEEMTDEAYNATLKSIKDLLPGTTVDEIVSTHFTKDRVMEMITQAKARNFAEMEKQLSGFKKIYFRKLVELYDDQNTSYNKIMSGIISLEEEIKRTGKNIDEVEEMLQITSIARHSTDYWHKNEFKWRLAMNSIIIGVTDHSVSRANDGHWPKYFAFEYDITMFIMVTEEGTAYILKCPGGTVWDKTLCTCVIPPKPVDDNGNNNGGTDWEMILADINGAATGASVGGGLGGIIGAIVYSGITIFI